MTMSYFDIHTHHIPLSFEQAVYACSMHETSVSMTDGWCSVGIHPWQLTEADAEMQLERLSRAVDGSNVVAVGECGLDKLRGASMPVQEKIFKACAVLAERVDLPLIIHAVKCTEELFRIRREVKPQMPWIVHGFRGREEMAEQYLKQGFYLSFGEHFNEGALRSTPLDRLFLETDESTLPIEGIYRKAAQVYGFSEEILQEYIASNVQKVLYLR